jgi:hypothetical protein
MRSSGTIDGCEILTGFDLDGLSIEQLESMIDAGREVVDIHRLLAKTSNNIVGELLRGHETFFEWDHYPPGDVYDHDTHSQFYYHAHPIDQRFPDEHGHFHTFLRPKGMPLGVKPAPVPNYKAPEDPNDALSHLIGISMDPRGFAFRLFSVNRWVTGEIWYNAGDVIRMLECFDIDHTQPSWPVNRWITAMLRFYRPQIARLLTTRDRAVAAWQLKRKPEDVYEDRRFEVPSYLDIDVDRDLAALTAAFEARA